MNSKFLSVVIIGLVCTVYLAGLVHYAQVRPIDGDEGYYVTAARLVWEGQTPYRDFTYPQAPLLPYVYSWIWAIRPQSLISMRFLSAACGGIAVFVWGMCLLLSKRIPRDVALATFSVVLLNPYWVSWNVVVKTFAVANLLMSIAVICLYVGLHSERVRWYFFAGLVLGACASARALYGPLIPCVCLWLLYTEWRTLNRSHSKTLIFLAGATCGLLPMILSFLGDPRAFVFNNIHYRPLIDSRVSFRHTIHVYLNVLINLFSNAHYFVAEVLLAVVGGISLLKLFKKQDPAYTDRDYLYFELVFLMLLVYIATALIPFPTFDQYFDSPLVPFLIPFVAVGLRLIFRSGRKWVFVFALVVPILFLRDINRDALQCSSPSVLQLSSYHHVTETIQANSRADDVVLSFWPGYVFESGRRYFSGSENKFNYFITEKMSSADRARYHVISKDEVMRAVSQRAVSMLVTYPRVFDRLDEDLSPTDLQAFRAALNANYSLIAKIDFIEVYGRR
jgi:hypothetical protein